MARPALRLVVDDTDEAGALTAEENRQRRAARREVAEESEPSDRDGASEGDGRRGTHRPGVSNEEAKEKAQSEENEQQPKSYGTILEEEIFQGLHELERPVGGLFLSGLSAGLDIGFSVLIMAVLITLLDGVIPDAFVEIGVANAYAVGFVFVVVGRSELFTEHTTLAVFPVLGGRASPARLARLWGIVYVSNLVGAAVFAAMMVAITPALPAVDAEAFARIAHRMTDPEWHVILTSAVLAGWMMGLLSWLLAAAQETISRIVVVWLVTGGIGLVGLHHCIVGSVEVIAGVLVDGALTPVDYLRFLLFATLGNAIGGVFFVGLIKYSHAVKGPQIPPRAS